MNKFIISTICILFSVVGTSAQSMYVSAMNGTINVRSTPSTTALKIGSLSTSDLALCLEELDGWYKIDFNGKDAYVSQSVVSTCDAVIPDEMFGLDIESSEPLDKIRQSGSIRLDKIDNEHAVIHMDWLRINLPAESVTYIADIKDGRVTATYGASGLIDTDRPLKEILEDIGEPLKKPINVGYDEFGSSIIFNGAKFSLYD